MRRSLPLLAALVLSSLCAAQTYYVDAVGGSDANPGTTRAQAFKSITFASSFLIDDDTLIVMAGTYSPSLTGELYPIKFGATTSQMRIRIIAESGPNATILDGENQMTSSLMPIMRFYSQADGALIRGIQFLNATGGSYWSMAIRLGSTSGGNFEAKNVELTGCIFRNGYRAIVIFGSNGSAGGSTTSGLKIHDNLFDNNTHRQIAAWGDGLNYIYNNTFVDGGYEAVYTDSLGSANTQGPSNAVVTNNVSVNCSNVGNLGGFVYGTNITTNNAVFESNLGFNNGGGDFVGGTFNASNITADPMFVSATDFHVQGGSPVIETGSPTVLPMARLDLDGFSRIHDSDGNGFAGIDRGAYQYTQYSMTVTGVWAPGSNVVFNFAAPSSGGAVLIFALGEFAFPLTPFGMIAFDPVTMMTAASAGASPGTFPFTVPNDPNLLGNTLVIQGGHIGPPIHLTNAVSVTF